jgi:hypothetical protein
VRSRLGAVASIVLVLGLVGSSVVRAQEPPPAPPGPYVVDVRGVMAGIPNATAFFPTVPLADAVPARGFGIDLGAHVYPMRLGPSRIGLGVNLVRVRGRVGPPDVTARFSAAAPQISFNFGSRSGWSHLSFGYGTAGIRSQSAGGVASSGNVGAVNMGGGARWFLTPHAAVSFDIRFYRLAAGDSTPKTTIVAASVGVSLR